MPRTFQPALGGLIVGVLALVTPQVLSSGHTGLSELFGPSGGSVGCHSDHFVIEGGRIGGFARGPAFAAASCAGSESSLVLAD